MRRSEWAMQWSLEAANNHATGIQHRLAQVTAESGKSQKLLFNIQKSVKEIKAEMSELTEQFSDWEDESKKAHLGQSQDIKSLKKTLIENTTTLENLNKKLTQCTKASNCEIDILNEKVKELVNERLTFEAKIMDLGNKNNELSKLLQEKEDSLNKKEQMLRVLEKKNAEMEANQNDISALKKEIQQMNSLTTQVYEQSILEKEKTILEKEKTILENEKNHSKTESGIGRDEPGYAL